MTQFGLLGGFPGDTLTLARATQLAEQLRGPDSESVESSAVVALLEELPFSGRVEFVLHAICESGSRDRLIRQLFDACFVSTPPASADEAPLEALGADSRRSLDPQRYSTLRLVVFALPRCGPLGVELFHAYRKTTSTVLFRPFLEAMVASPLFTDAELEAVFVGAVDASRRAILDLCKLHPHRGRLVGELVAMKLAPLAMLNWANAEAVDALLTSGSVADVAAFEALGFSNWKAFSTVYLDHLRRRLQSKAHDPLEKGKLFRQFESHVVQLRAADVVELFRICDEHQPMEIAASVAPGVRAFLEEASSKGALHGDYEGVTPVLPCARLVRALLPEDKIALLKSSTLITARGWHFSESHEAVCELVFGARVSRTSAKWLFLDFTRSALEALSEEAAWDTRTLAPPDPVQRAFQSFDRFLDLARWSQNRLSLSAVDAWLALHQRTAPTPAIVARYAGKHSEAELWTLWAQQAVGRVVEHTKVIARKSALALHRCSHNAPRSTLTSYAPYAKLLVDRIQSVWATPGQQVDLAFHLHTVADLADAFALLFRQADQELGHKETSVGKGVVDALRASLESMIVFALDRADAGLVFDPAADRYVTEKHHTQLAPLLARIATHLPHLPALKQRLFAFCEGIFNRVVVPENAARLGFVEVAAKGRKSFVSFNLAMHKAWSATALQLLTAVRGACADGELAGRSWERYKHERFNGRPPKRSEKKFGEYLDECRNLPPDVRAQEKARLLEAAVALLRAGEFDPVAESFARLGWLLEALDACGDTLPTREKYLLKFGDISVPAVRQLLQNATSDREPTVRFQAHLALMQRSKHDFVELATTLAFVAQRTRNEAGLHRPMIYQWLQDQMAAIVRLSLESDAALVDVGTLCQALEKMLRDDVSKRDTVAKNAFRSIASLMLATAATWDSARPRIETRRRWIHCAVQLDWIVVRALHGEEGSQAFVWPLHGATMPRDRTVPEAWIDDFQRFLAENFRAGENRSAELKRELYERKLARGPETAPRFEAVEAVELLVQALRAAERPAMDEAPDELSQAKVFPAIAESTLLQRAKALFAFARTQWTEVPRLVQFFEAMVASLETSSEPTHVRQTAELFQSVRAQYPRGSLWYEVPLLAQACDQLLNAAIRLQLTETASKLFPTWTELRNGRGRTPIARGLSLAQVQYLAAELAGLEARVLEAGSLPERRATSARVLLEKTPSSAYLVVGELIAFRDDLLLRYVKKSRGELQGVFDPKPPTESEAQGRALISVPSSQWPLLNAATMLAYTRDALDDAMTAARSPQSRSMAIAQFVQSPASRHSEVIDLLGKLTAKPQDPTATDDARELLLETVILCVFQTDAAWLVLAYLLSPDVIASSPRTIASILSNLHSWVPMDKAVSVLRVLLETERRGALQVFLHKSIVRMLFDTPNAEARSLFAREWSAPMHADVRHEMVKLAVSALADPDAAKAKIAWTIVEEVARRPADFGPTTVFLLFLPTVLPVGQRPIDALLRIPMPNSEVPDSFGWLHEKWLVEAPIHFDSAVVRERLREVLRVIASGTHPYLRTVAACKEFTLSPCAVGVEEDASLDRLQELLLSCSTRWTSGPHPFPKHEFGFSPEDDYLLQVAPKIFASLGLQVLSKKLEGYTEHERRTAKALEEVCERQRVAQRLRAVFGALLDALARVPPIEVEKRLRLTRVAQGLVATAREWGFGKALFSQHFQDALGFLRGDAERLLPIL